MLCVANLLGTSVFLTEAKNVVLLGPPGTGKTYLAVGSGTQAAKNGHRVLFDTAIGWVSRLQEAHERGKLAELVKLRRYSVFVVRTPQTQVKPRHRSKESELCRYRHSVTKSAIYRSIRTQRICSSNSFPAVTNTHR
jgi:chromosomal replication initiation ATPase DnaA